MGLQLANITIGNPYFNPFVTRPYDSPVGNVSKPK